MVQLWKEEQRWSQRQDPSRCRLPNSMLVFNSSSLSPCAPSHTCAAWLQWIETFTSSGRAAAVNYFKKLRAVSSTRLLRRGEKSSSRLVWSHGQDNMTATTAASFAKGPPFLSSLLINSARLLKTTPVRTNLMFCFVETSRSRDCDWRAFALMATVSDCYHYFFCTSDGLSSWLIISDPSH